MKSLIDNIVFTLNKILWIWDFTLTFCLLTSGIFLWRFYQNSCSAVKCDSSWMLQLRNTKATSCLFCQKEQFQQYKGRHCEACSFQFLWNACILFLVSSRKSHVKKARKRKQLGTVFLLTEYQTEVEVKRAQAALDGSRED